MAKSKEKKRPAKASMRSIIKDSERIRAQLIKRWDELKMTRNTVHLDATLKGATFTMASLSKYVNHGNVKNSLSEEAIIWLCTRYGISIKLLVGKPTLKGTTLTMVEEPYNEQKCLENLKLIFK